MGNCASMESDAAGRVRTSKKRRKLDDRKAKDGNGGEISFLAENGADLSSSGRKKGRGKTKRGNVRNAAVGVGNNKHGSEGVCDMMQQGAAPSEEEDVVRHCSNALSLPSNSSRSDGESAAGQTIKSPLLMTGARGGGFNSSNNNNNNNNIDEPAAVTNPLLPPSVPGSIARSPTMPPRPSPFIEPGAPERTSKFAFDEVLENSTSAVSSKSAEHRRGSGSTATPSLAVTAPSSAALCRMPRSPPGVVGSTTDAPRSPAVAPEKTHDPAGGVVAPQPTDVAPVTEQPTSPLLLASEKHLEEITNAQSHSQVQQSRSPRLSPSRKLAQHGRTSPRVVRASPVNRHHMRASTEASIGDSADDSTELPPMVLGHLQDDAPTQLQPATNRFSGGGHEGGARSSSSSRSNGGGGSVTRPPPVPTPNGNGPSPTAAAAAVGSEQQFSITHRRRYESNASSLASKTSSSNLSSLTVGSSSNFSRGTRSGPSAGVSPSSRFRDDHHLPTFGGMGSLDYGSGSDDRRESASRRSTTNTSRGFSTFSLDAFFDNNHQRTASMPRNAQQRIVSFRGGLDDNNADDGRSPSMAMTDYNDDGARRDTSVSLVSNRSRMHSGSSSSVWSASSATAAVVGGGGRRAQTMTLATFQAA